MSPFKRHISTLFASLFCCVAFSQSVQNGYTVEYNGARDKTPLAGVNIVAGGATARSNQMGAFRLQFNTLKIGDRVSADLQSVATLRGYVLFNKDAVQQWSVTGKNTAFTIVLCKKRLFDKLVRRYYNLCDSSYREQYRKEHLRVEQLLREGAIQQEEYERRLREAELQHQRDLQTMNENAELLARIDESELDSSQMRIHELLKEGRIDDAVQLINPERSFEMLDHASQKREFVQQKMQEAEAEYERMIESMMYEISVLRIKGGRESMRLCGDYWRKIIASDTTNLMHVWRGAYFFNQQCDYITAEHYYLMAMRQFQLLAEENPMVFAADYSSILNNLAILYDDIHDYDRAEEYHTKALSLLRYLADKDSAVYNPVYASSLNNVANLYADLGQYKRAERYLAEALRIRKDLATANAEVYGAAYATTLSNMGALYHDVGELQLAERLHRQALSLREALALRDSATYSPDVATSLNNLGNVCADLGQYDEAVRCLAAAAAIRRNLAAANPDAYEGDYAMTLCNLGRLYIHQRQFTEAAECMTLGVDLMRTLAARHPVVYQDPFLQALEGLASLRFRLGQWDAAEVDYAEALDLRTSRGIAAGEAYARLLTARAVNMMAAGDATSARRLYDVALRWLNEQADSLYDPYITVVTLNMATICMADTSLADSSEHWLLRAIDVLPRLVQRDSLRYQSQYATALYNLAALMNNRGAYADAEPYMLQALAIRRDMASSNPQKNNPAYIQALRDMADLCRNLNRPDDADLYTKQAEELMGR